MRGFLSYLRALLQVRTVQHGLVALALTGGGFLAAGVYLLKGPDKNETAAILCIVIAGVLSIIALLGILALAWHSRRRAGAEGSRNRTGGATASGAAESGESDPESGKVLDIIGVTDENARVIVQRVLKCRGPFTAHFVGQYNYGAAEKVLLQLEKAGLVAKEGDRFRVVERHRKMLEGFVART